MVNYHTLCPENADCAKKKDITETISVLNLNISSIDMGASEGIATCILIMEIRDTRQLERLNTRIQKIPNFISLERM